MAICLQGTETRAFRQLRGARAGTGVLPSYHTSLEGTPETLSGSEVSLFSEWPPGFDHTPRSVKINFVHNPQCLTTYLSSNDVSALTGDTIQHANK